PIYTAGVNERMVEVAGRVADGLLGHVLFTTGYIEDVVRPAIERGAKRTGRDPRDVQVASLVLACAHEDPELARREAAAMLAFYALTSTELLVGVGGVLRMLAASEGGLEDFQRSQALSAFSVTRLLASEQQAAADLLATTKADMAAALAADERPEMPAARARIEVAADGPELGEAVGALLDALPRDDALRRPIHAALRDMSDREVAAL